MGTRLEAISCKLRGQMNNMEMIVSLNQLTPILNANANAMPLEQMYRQLEAFTGAYDDLTVKGNILQDGIEKTLGEQGTQRNVDSMMNGLKADVAMEMGADPNLANPV